MIKYKHFEFERDKFGWMLHIWRDGTRKKTKEPIRVKDTFYYANVENVLKAIIDRSLGGCESIEEMKNFLEEFPTKWEIDE